MNYLRKNPINNNIIYWLIDIIKEPDNKYIKNKLSRVLAYIKAPSNRICSDCDLLWNICKCEGGRESEIDPITKDVILRPCEQCGENYCICDYKLSEKGLIEEVAYIAKRYFDQNLMNLFIQEIKMFYIHDMFAGKRFQRLLELLEQRKNPKKLAPPLKGFVGNIEKSTILNNYFRKILYTSPHLQLVLMTLKPKEDIGEEIHKDRDQFFRFGRGTGKVKIDKKYYNVKNGDVIIIPQGTLHNVINVGTKPLKFYTIYGPPEHKDKTINKTKPKKIRNR